MLFRSDCVPAKVLAFLQIPGTQEIRAIVHACEFRQNIMKAASCVTELWRLEYTQVTEKAAAPRTSGGTSHRACGYPLGEADHVRFQPVLQVVDLNAIECQCLVVEMNPTTRVLAIPKGDGPPQDDPHSPTNVILVEEYAKWGARF